MAPREGPAQSSRDSYVKLSRRDKSYTSYLTAHIIMLVVLTTGLFYHFRLTFAVL